jgi:hypothetical protein
MEDNNSTNQNSTKDTPNDYYKDKEIQKEVMNSTDDEPPRKNGFIGV